MASERIDEEMRRSILSLIDADIVATLSPAQKAEIQKLPLQSEQPSILNEFFDRNGEFHDKLAHRVDDPEGAHDSALQVYLLLNRMAMELQSTRHKLDRMVAISIQNTINPQHERLNFRRHGAPGFGSTDTLQVMGRALGLCIDHLLEGRVSTWQAFVALEAAKVRGTIRGVEYETYKALLNDLTKEQHGVR